MKCKAIHAQASTKALLILTRNPKAPQYSTSSQVSAKISEPSMAIFWELCMLGWEAILLKYRDLRRAAAERKLSLSLSAYMQR